MNPRIALPFALFAAGVIVVVLYLASRPADATLLLINGNIHTVDAGRPAAGAVAIRGAVIVGVGSTEEISSGFTAPQIIDLEGRTVVPGFIDSHAHLEGLGAALLNLNISSAADPAGILAMVKARVATTSPSGWIRGRGWDQNRWPVKQFPTAAMLDAVAPDHPVYLKRIDGHALWVNSVAMKIAGITAATPDPEGGWILRFSDGSPAGVFLDKAVDLVDVHVPEPSAGERMRAVERALQECPQFGLTGVHDMGVDLGSIEIYRTLISRGRFPTRVYAAIDGEGETWSEFREKGPMIDGGGGRLTVRALKLYMDGALGSRGAALIESYSDDPENRGLTLMSETRLRDVVRDAVARGFQVCTHAIGDRANHIVLSAYEQILTGPAAGNKDLRLRIEHAQVIAPEDLPRFKALGVLPMMQPTHCTSDMPWAPTRLGEKRLAGAYAWRSLLETGVVLPAGSDAPVESPNPLLGFYAAVTRQDHAGNPPGGWTPGQVMTREEALKAFTLWGAYAAFEESRKGSIVPGKLADLAVLTQDIMTCPAPEILATSVFMTILGGEVVFARDPLAVRRVEADAGH